MKEKEEKIFGFIYNEGKWEFKRRKFFEVYGFRGRVIERERVRDCDDVVVVVCWLSYEELFFLWGMDGECLWKCGKICIVFDKWVLFLNVSILWFYVGCKEYCRNLYREYWLIFINRMCLL